MDSSVNRSTLEYKPSHISLSRQLTAMECLSTQGIITYTIIRRHYIIESHRISSGSPRTVTYTCFSRSISDLSSTDAQASPRPCRSDSAIDVDNSTDKTYRELRPRGPINRSDKLETSGKQPEWPENPVYNSPYHRRLSPFEPFVSISLVPRRQTPRYDPYGEWIRWIILFRHRNGPSRPVFQGIKVPKRMGNYVNIPSKDINSNLF